MSVLAADVGGTKTNIALFGDHETEPLRAATYASGEAGSLPEIIADFLGGARSEISAAGFGVAGPVLDGHVRLTKLGWQLDRVSLMQDLGCPVALVNDLVATAMGIEVLPPAALVPIQTGEAVADAPVAVIAPGTGLGVAFMVPEGGRHRALATEGGHVPFAPVDDEQAALLAFARREFSLVSYDLLCSGRGLSLIHRFLVDREPSRADNEVSRQVGAAADPAPVIAAAGLDEKCPACAAALDLFAAVIAGAAANLALTTLARGGVYLGGGIPPRILPVLQRAAWRAAFAGNGPLRDFLATLPVTVITEPRTALFGAARLARESAGEWAG